MIDRQLTLKLLRDKIEEMHQLITSLIIDDTPPIHKAENVRDVTLKYAGLTMTTLTQSRKGSLIFYKRIMCYIMYDYCNVSYHNIADMVLLTNHATVKHHVDKMRWWMGKPEYAPKEVVETTKNILHRLGYEKN